MLEKDYKRKDIVVIAERVYLEAGGRESIILRIKKAQEVSRRWSYAELTGWRLHKYESYDQRDTDATTALVVLHLENPNDTGLSYAADYKEIMLSLAEAKYFIDVVWCDRAFDQVGVTILAHSWMYMKKSPFFNEIFSAKEARKIIGWFHDYAKLLLRDKDSPTYLTFRPYDNQEIGVGCLTILAQVLMQDYPQLAKGLMEVADSRVYGWALRNRNPDDTLFYEPIWIKSVYFYALYRKPEWLGNENCRQSFEDFLHQMPGNGLNTVYNWMFSHSYPDIMALGARIFKDGRYKWMANRLLQERIEERPRRSRHVFSELASLEYCEDYPLKYEAQSIDKYDHIWEGWASNVFHLWLFWDDDVLPVKPVEGSMILEKTSGGHYPDKPSKPIPDKIVFRDGWEKDSLFAILNLRGYVSKGGVFKAHRYAGSNEVITIVYDEPFVIEAQDFWHRDCELERWRLNAFCIREDGKWLHEPCGETPQDAELVFFKNLHSLDVSKTVLSEYYGWINERICILAKNRFFAVLDICNSNSFGEAGVRWHLKGEYDFKRDKTVLRLFGKRMVVYYPHAGEYKVEAEENTETIPVYQHKPSISLSLVSKSDRMGFTTLFIPGGDEELEAESIKVKDLNGRLAFPMALGVLLRQSGEIIGARSFQLPAVFDYGMIKTDAEAFVLKPLEGRLHFDFVNSHVTCLECLDRPSRVELDGRVLSENYWEYSYNRLSLNLPVSSGSLSIVLRSGE
ncbi:MAG: hypothetical protein NZ873_00340 [Crenarchaeota archaeon]|nr:hypothetical protein [Thermoproteota archaeon]MDW8033505.1 hypothetical protein [Nitrososphaerota archaeon]